MRISLWRGMVAGSILGVAMSMMVGARRRRENQNIFRYGSRQARTRARQMLRGVRKTVNGLIK